MRVPPTGYGGTEAVIDVLARALHALGHEVLLFTTGDSTCDVPMASVLPVAPGIYEGGSPLEVEHVAAAYEALGGCEVIHDHTTLGPLLFGRHSTVPCVTTNHNPFREPFSSTYRLLDGAVPVIVVSRHHADSAGELRVAAVIHHGVFPEEFPVGEGSGGFALFLGRITEEKGAHHAARLARRLGLRLVIAGRRQTELEERYFEAEVAPLLGDGVEYLGEVDRKTKLDLLGAASCLLNPIGWPEPFGMVMLEALACGTPVVALRYGAVGEIVDDGVTGLLAARPDELGECLSRVGDLDRVACRAVVEARFSAWKMAEAHAELYARVAATWRGARP